ncbi:MAG: S26 family signal peptidase [Thermoplasmatota archaeon]
MNLKKHFIYFWKTDNSKIVFIRDILIALLAVFIVLLLLWSYTGQWLQAPMVAIESGSMEHTPPIHPTNPPFGRLGTIDAGDMVLVKKVYTINDIITHGGPFGGAQAENGWQSFGEYGDVIIFKPLGRDDTPQIIHRAMCWVDVHIQADTVTYTIAEYGIFSEETLTIPELGLENKKPSWEHSGYLTKGDNNRVIDQITSICPQPVKVEWISGKARVEIPWLGTINLFFDDFLSGRLFTDKSTVANVHTDCLICLGIVIVSLISIPVVLDIYDYQKEKKNKDKQ